MFGELQGRLADLSIVSCQIGEESREPGDAARRNIARGLAHSTGNQHALELGPPSRGYQWRPERDWAREWVANYECIERQALRRAAWKGRRKLFEMQFWQHVECPRAISLTSAAPGSFDYWSSEVKRGVGREGSHSGLFPPAQYLHTSWDRRVKYGDRTAICDSTEVKRNGARPVCAGLLRGSRKARIVSAERAARRSRPLPSTGGFLFRGAFEALLRAKREAGPIFFTIHSGSLLEPTIPAAMAQDSRAKRIEVGGPGIGTSAPRASGRLHLRRNSILDCLRHDLSRSREMRNWRINGMPKVKGTHMIFFISVERCSRRSWN